MRTSMTIICIILTATFNSFHCSAGDTFMDYQNYDHGYCPECNCYPCRCNATEEELGIETELPAPPCAPCGAAVVPPGALPLPVPAPPPAAAVAAKKCPTCKKPDPCDPAPVCATNCGVSLCWIGIGIAVVATAAAIIVSTNNGRDPTH
jgi:hypothetical protein